MLSPSRNGLGFLGGFGRQRCPVLTFLRCVILHRGGGLGLLWLLYQLFSKEDVPEVSFFQSQTATKGSRSSIWVLCSTRSSVLVIPSLEYLSVCLG